MAQILSYKDCEDLSNTITKSFIITLKHLGLKTQFGLNYKGITFKYNWIGY